MNWTARRTASIATSKQSEGLRAARTASGRVAIAAIDRLIEIGLFGLGRQAGRRAAALAVDDHQRQLGHDGEAERFALERDARTGRGSDAELAGIGGADGRADRGDFVFRLERRDVEFFQLSPDGAGSALAGVIG